MRKTVSALIFLTITAVAVAALTGETDDKTKKTTSGKASTPATGSFLTDAQRKAKLDAVNPFRHLRATGKAKQVIAAGRTQMGVEYVYGAGPRDPSGLRAIGNRAARGGFDCSSFVAYAFELGVDTWVSGNVAHTDQIWTQGGQLPLDSSAGSTSKIVRGTDADRPPGGYKVGDIILTRWGSGGFWGHVVIVSARGMALESYPPDVHETRPIQELLTGKNDVGWVRVRALQT